MKGNYLLHKVNTSRQYRDLVSCLQIYFISPLKAGLIGFAIYFTIFVLIKLSIYKMLPLYQMNIDYNDITLSSIGFWGAFIVKASQNFRGEN